MQLGTQKSIHDLLTSLRSRKSSADAAFQKFELKQIARELSTSELKQAEGWQAPSGIPTMVKPRIR
jgi:hypothetical protein